MKKSNDGYANSTEDVKWGEEIATFLLIMPQNMLLFAPPFDSSALMA